MSRGCLNLSLFDDMLRKPASNVGVVRGKLQCSLHDVCIVYALPDARNQVLLIELLALTIGSCRNSDESSNIAVFEVALVFYYRTSREDAVFKLGTVEEERKKCGQQR